MSANCRRLPFTTVLAAQAEVEAAERSRGEAPRSFAPVIGQGDPASSVRAGRAATCPQNIPLIVSTVLDERTYRETNFDMTWDAGEESAASRMVGDDADKVLAMYRDEDSAGDALHHQRAHHHGHDLPPRRLRQWRIAKRRRQRGRRACLVLPVDDAQRRPSAAATAPRMASMFHRQCTTFASR